MTQISGLANKGTPAQAPATPSPESTFSKLVSYLMQPIDGASLAVFRIWFGICLIANVYSWMNRFSYMYLEPKFLFSFVPNLPHWPGQNLYFHFEIVAALSLAIALGLYYRVASIAFFAAWTYVLLLDKTYYQNHYYLISLLGFLFAITPANRVWSLDNKLDDKTKATNKAIPRWSLLVFKVQIVLVYFFGGIAKLNSDWLQGMPQRVWLLGAANNPIVGRLVGQEWFVQLITYGGIAVDLGVGFLLLYRKTFWFGAAVAVLFNLMNSQLFKIGIFPWLMLGTIGLFAPPDWPRRLLGAIRRSGKSDIDAAADDLSARFSEEPSKPVETSPKPWNKAVACVVVVYFAVQLLAPLRRFLFNGDTNWTEQGRRFSWGMMLRDKQVDHFLLRLIDPRSLEAHVVNPEDYLNRDQTYVMSWTPDMILQFAHYLADDYESKTGVRPLVKAEVSASLNLRKPQVLIDPDADLASKQDSAWRSYDWVMPIAPSGITEKKGF